MLIRKDVLNLTIPIITEQTFVMSMGVINTIMASRLGKEAVSAIGMVDSINNIFIAFFSALAVGGTVVVAQYIGQGNVKYANESAKQAIYSGTLLSLIITTVMWIFRRYMITLLFGSAELSVINNANIYMTITLLTYPLISLQLIASGVLRGAGDTKTPMKITIIMNIINVILSYLLIYGLRINLLFLHMFFVGLGVRGAALGIASARIVGTVAIMLVLIRGSKIIKLTQMQRFKLNTILLKSIFNIGIPASIESLLFNGGKLITQIYIVDMGTISIAANYIAGSVAGLLNIPGSALSIAATTIVGQDMGKGNSDEAKDSMWYLTKLSTLCLTILGAFSFPLAKMLVSLYTQNNDIIILAATLLKWNAVWLPVWSLAFVLPAGLKGAGDAKYTMVTSIIGMWVFRITLGYILGIPLKMGVVGVWLGMFIDWLIRGILYYIRLQNGKWKEHTVIQKLSY
ncbi:putative efflux protein, MATE family [Caldanaerobius fijiensis DSM 17918]|uniref:Probable multidrug resistance protein NorM n=1 Tax=Caldanaerobius fijiensis DSM 17918 TaxID=1121256 RepID=A0A1M4SRQ9_9THEO|nr:MATE family efflux transporter [Caldanaerobius fijiensis]SHE34868.1 putative efflux protein, MATE family [Caldanaerobius fijiensis DSM 17918]